MIRRQQNQRQQEEPRHRDHLYAQRLNNVAASCIESGEHDKAIAILAKALCLSPVNPKSPSSVEEMSTSPCCSLDECIAYSEERPSQTSETEAQHHGIRDECGPKNKRRKVDIRNLPPTEETISEDRQTSVGYIHQRPIFVTPTILNEVHIMGPILSLIITFNLALVNHMKLIAASEKNTTPSAATRERLRKVLRLYELAYQWEGEFRKRQHQHCRDANDENTSSCNDKPQELRKSHQEPKEDQHEHSGPASATAASAGVTNTGGCSCCSSNKCSSLRFDIIVCNNLSQIHRMAQNHSKEEKCLHHLLSILMFVVDWQRDRCIHDNNDNGDVGGDEQQQQQQGQQSGTSPSEESKLTNEQGQHQQQQQNPGRSSKRKRSTNYMDLDGFWQNIVPFLLKDDCAKAA